MKAWNLCVCHTYLSNHLTLKCVFLTTQVSSVLSPNSLEYGKTNGRFSVPAGMLCEGMRALAIHINVFLSITVECALANRNALDLIVVFLDISAAVYRV